MAKYRKKPVIVDAVQWHEGDDLLPGMVIYPTWIGGGKSETHSGLQTLQGVVRVSDNDWIITGANGEHYPCKPGIFEKTYDKVIEATYKDAGVMPSVPYDFGDEDDE